MYLLDWLAPFKKEGNLLHKRELEFYTSLLDDVRREVEQGTASRSIAVLMLERQAEFGFSDIEAAYTLGALYIAAVGTTSATMMSFCLAMCHFPQWQERLQEEVDQVVGAHRLPNLEDSPNLPLTRAIIKEVMRVWPVTAGGDAKLPSFYQPSIWLTVCIGFPHLLT
jgi:cytochrome P450